MTTLALEIPVCELPGSTFVDDIRQLLRNEIARRQRKHLFRRLSRMSPRLLADMGVDPDEARRAAESSWDELRPDLMLRNAPWI